MPAPVPFRVGLVLLGIIIFAVVSSWQHMLGDVYYGSVTDPLSIEIAGLQDTDAQRIQVTFLPPDNPLDPAEPSYRELIALSHSRFSWHIPLGSVVELHLTASRDVLDRLESVSVIIGGNRSTFDRAHLTAEWRPLPVIAEAVDQPDGSEVSLAWPKLETNQVINIREPRGVLMDLSKRALAIAAICWSCCLALIIVMRRFRSDPGVYAEVPYTEPAALWLTIGFAVFCVGVVIARSGEPYAFTQDDNFSQFLPVILRSAQALFQGRFPVWNPHQLLGAPTATVGTYMLTYPPTYLSYWIARQVFGDPYATIEVFNVLHLAAGYFISYMVLRRFGLRPSLSVAGALSFALSAFLLIAGRSQSTFVPVAVWLPLLAASVLALERQPVSWKWALATGAIVGVYYHAGHAQMWFYALMFFSVAVVLLVAGGRIPWRRALWCIPALTFGVALAAPLLFLQLAELSGRHLGSGGTGISLLGMLIPLGRWGQDIRQPFSRPEWSGQMPYFGTTFAAGGFMGIGYYFYLLAFCKPKGSDIRRSLGDAAWLILMTFAVLLALGPDGVLWPLMAHVPPFKDFRWPNKLLPFVAFFACVGGGRVLERWSSQRRPVRAQYLATATMALVLLNTYWARSSWYTFADRPYPALDHSYASLIAPENAAGTGRILTRPHWDTRSPIEGVFRTQILNFPTVTGAFSVGGYDTFVETTFANRQMLKRLYTDPIPAAKAYGVRWVIWDKVFSDPVFSPNPGLPHIERPRIRERKLLLSVRREAVPALTVDGTELYRMNDTDPLAFIEGPEKKPLALRFDMRGAIVNTAGISRGVSVVVNVLWRPWMKAFVDGRLIECYPDAWGRVSVPLKEPSEALEVLYRPPWISSSLAGLGIAILAAVFGLFLRIRERRRVIRT